MVAEAVRALIPASLDPWARDNIEDVLDAAAEWANGALPLPEFARIGTITYWRHGVEMPSPGYTRWLAVVTAAANDPRRGHLLNAIEALLRARPDLRVDESGIWSRWDLLEAGMPV